MPINLLSGGSGTVFYQDIGYAGTVSGNISGNGTLTKAGAGTLSLTGTNNYSGLTTVQAGTLELGPSAQSPVLTGGGANIQGGKVGLRLPGPGADDRARLATSYDGGLWNVGQFLSTTEDAVHGLGWADNGSGT